MSILVNYYISTSKSLLNIQWISDVLGESFWSKNIPIEYVGRFIKHSLCFGIYEKNNDQQIGFGRVISDYTTYAYICDVIIHKNHRRIGLGQALINEMMSHTELQGLKSWTLKTTKEAKKLYEKKGFARTKNPELSLEIDDLDIYSRKLFRNIHV